jgi:serine beta-lactamase-like protein LACTB
VKARTICLGLVGAGQLSSLCLAAGLLHAQVVPAIAPSPSRYGDAIARGRLIVEAIRQHAGVPGVSVAVGVDGAVVWSEGFGYADLENRVPATEQTRFRVGSVSKPITAAAVGLLVEQGRLDLDAPVQKYVPTFPEKRWPITTRQLAGHLAGVRHYRGAESYSSKHYTTVLEGLEIFQDDTLLYEPGTRYSYSSYGWNLISAVLEGASGENFLQYMQDRVFEPLGLAHIVADHVDSIIPHRTRFYARTRAGTVLNADYVDSSYKWAGGGFLSNTADLVRFGMAHLTDELLRPETVALLWTSQTTTEGEETGYGIGWDVGSDYEGRRIVSHGGSSIGGRAHLLIFPDDGVVVAMLANSSAPVNEAATWAVAERFLEPRGAVAESSADNPNLANFYECEVELEDRTVNVTLRLLGSPAGYRGELVAGEQVSPIVVASSQGHDLSIVALQGGFWVGNVRLTVEGEGATGNINSSKMICEVRNAS